MKVKICGIMSFEDVVYCNDLLPDYVGFIFSESKRRISLSEAEMFKSYLDKRIQVVGVFINEDISFIKKILDAGVIDMIQLQGDESSKYLKTLREITTLPIINNNKDSRYAEYTVFNGQEAGSGKMINWNTIKSKKPFFIGGGLNAFNIKDAVKVNPFAVDVSTGVEINGKKNYELMKEFITTCKAL